MKSNIYAIQLNYPKTFDEFLKKLTKWRNIRDSLYSMAYSIRPYHSIGLDIETGNIVNEPYIITTETYNNLVKQTIKVLDLVGKFYETNSSYNALYPSMYSDHRIISTTTPLEYEAAENLVFDLQQIKNGVSQILKSYGQWNTTDNFWVMDSRTSAYKAIELILSEYPIFPQLVSNFNYPTYTVIDEDANPPTTKQVSLLELIIETVTPEVLRTNPILKVIWDAGLGSLIGDISSKKIEHKLCKLLINLYNEEAYNNLINGEYGNSYDTITLINSSSENSVILSNVSPYAIGIEYAGEKCNDYDNAYFYGTFNENVTSPGYESPSYPIPLNDFINAGDNGIELYAYENDLSYNPYKLYISMTDNHNNSYTLTSNVIDSETNYNENNSIYTPQFTDVNDNKGMYKLLYTDVTNTSASEPNTEPEIVPVTVIDFTLNLNVMDYNNYNTWLYRKLEI